MLPKQLSGHHVAGGQPPEHHDGYLSHSSLRSNILQPAHSRPSYAGTEQAVLWSSHPHDSYNFHCIMVSHMEAPLSVSQMMVSNASTSYIDILSFWLKEPLMWDNLSWHDLLGTEKGSLLMLHPSLFHLVVTNFFTMDKI